MIINLTGHDVTVKKELGGYRTIKSTGNIRMSSSIVELDPIDGVRITRSFYGAGVALPIKSNGAIYLVSKIVCEQHKDRKDFYIINEKSGSGAKTRAGSLSPNPYAYD